MENEDLKLRVAELENFVESLKSSTTIPFDVDGAFRKRLSDLVPEGLSNAPLTSVASPAGGATIDSQARSAVDSLITRLEGLGLINTN